MKRYLFLLVCLVGLLPGSARADRVGIVLIHGKQGFPGARPLAYLQQQLQSAGFVVDQPEMCWSKTRIYDRSLPDCMTDIDASLARLKNLGATSIVLVGHSLGGFGAIYYGSAHEGIKGVVALAPAPGPGVARRPDIAGSLQRAQSLIAAGQRDVSQTFDDTNTGVGGIVAIQVRATPAVIVSFFDMSGPANMVSDVGRLKAPLLWISGTRDQSQLSREAGFNRAPGNSQSRYTQIDAGHMDTPDKAANQVVDWIKSLPQ